MTFRFSEILSLVFVIFFAETTAGSFGGARWITPITAVANGTFAAYRSTWNVTCSNNATEEFVATLNIAIDTKYWFYINNELVIWEGGLKRGPTRTGGYYDTVDISSAKWNRNGSNIIAILGLYLGRKNTSVVPPLPPNLGKQWHNNEHADSGMHGVLISATVCGTTFATGHSEPGSGTAKYPPFRSIAHPAFSNDISDDANQNLRASEPDIVYDQGLAILKMNGWTSNDYDDSEWPLVVTSTKAGGLPWGELVARPIPLFRRSERRAYESTYVEIDEDDGDGWKSLGNGTFIEGGKFAIPLPQQVPNSIPSCKAACKALAACKAFVWNETASDCSLRRKTMLYANQEQSTVVYLRAFTRLIGKLPYDAQITPALSIIKKQDELSVEQSNALIDATQCMKFGTNTSKSAMRIDMRTDSYFTDGFSLNKANGEGIPNNRAAFIFDSSIFSAGNLQTSFEYESPGWLVGHSMRYSVDKYSPLAPLLISGVIEVGYYESGFDVDLTPAWSSKSNTNLTLLWKKAQRTLYVNARDNYMDCPDRERAQWWFDVSLDIHQSFYALDTAAHSLARKGILELANWQKIGSIAEPWAPLSIYSPVPGSWQSELPDQSLMSIAYGVSTYYLHTGDADTIRATIQAWASYLLSWTMDDTSGLVRPRDCENSSTPKPHAADAQCSGVWDWCDGQSVNCDYAPIDNAWYFWALNSTATLARVVNATAGISPPITTAQLRLIENRAVSIMGAYDKTFWDSTCSCYRSRVHRDRVIGATTNCTTKQDNCTLPDDRAQALAIVTGLAPTSKWKQVVSGILDLNSTAPNGASTFSSPPMEKFVLEAMFMAGETDAALTRMESRFGRMIAYSNYTTLWEHWDWDIITGAPIAGYNHGWSGGALVLLSQYVAGLAPTSVGWATFDVAPMLGSKIKDVNAYVLTKYGKISVNIETYVLDEITHLSLTVSVPRNTIGNVRLSSSKWRTISVVPTTFMNSHSTHERIMSPSLEGPGTWVIKAQN